MKEYQVVINREYTTHITLEFPDDGKDHKELINEHIISGDQEIWDLIAEKELEQMDISHEQWEISEITERIPTNQEILSAFNKITNLKNK